MLDNIDIAFRVIKQNTDDVNGPQHVDDGGHGLAGAAAGHAAPARRGGARAQGGPAAPGRIR